MSSNSLFDDLLGSTSTQFKFFGNGNSLHPDLSDQITRPTFSGTTTHRRDDVAWFNDCTEILGSESGDHFTAEEEEPASVLVPLQSNAAGISRSSSYSASTTRAVLRSDGQDFPPEYLSTLNRDGRPRFVLKKVRISNGESLRLLITMERDESFFRRSDVTMIKKKKKKKKKIDSLTST